MTGVLDAHRRLPAPTVEHPFGVARWELGVVGTAMLVVLTIGVVAISRDAPLLWDEAVYGLRVRDLVGDGVRGLYWIDVRAPGLPALLTPVARLLDDSVVVLRSACLAFAVAGVGVTWHVARMLAGPGVAAVAAWVLAVAPGWNESSWQIMPDIPGTVLTLAAMAVVLAAARTGRLSWWALMAAPLAGAATLVRYGAPLLIGPTVVAALLLRWDVVRASRLRAAAVLIATAAAAGAVWFIPQVTGSSRPPVLIYGARQDAKAVPALESAADFLSSLLALVGPVVGPLMVLGGVAAGVAAAHRRSLRGPVIASALIALIVLVLMLFGIAEYHVRYLVPALPFLAILTGIGLAGLAGRARPRAVMAGGVVLAVLAVAVVAGMTLERARSMHRIFGPVRDAYARIDSVTRHPCAVLDANPTAEWYTGCAAFPPADPVRLVTRTLPASGVAPDEPLWVVVRRWENRANPSPRNQALYEQMAVDAVDGSAEVFVLDMGSAGRLADALDTRDLRDGSAAGDPLREHG